MSGWRKFWTAYRAPVVLFVLLAALAAVFHHVLLPFLVALFIAFLIEPVVSWASRRRIGGRKVPRGLAVIGVYAVALSVSVIFSVAVGPQLGAEVGSLARDVPRAVQDLREEQLPALSERLARLMDRSVVTREDREAIESARQIVHEARLDAESQAFFVGGLTPDERARAQRGQLDVQLERQIDRDEDVMVRLRPEESGEWSVLMVSDDLRFEPTSNGGYRVSLETVEEAPEPTTSLDLVRVLDAGLSDLVESSGEKFTDALAFTQRLLGTLAGALLSILVTFMVAAFISIDVPGIIRFFRSLFPEETQPQIGQLLSELNRGLSGVIRGQLVICLVNGVLTWLGLFIFQVKFAFVLGVIAGVLSLIPVFGTIISTIPCVLIGLAQSFTTGVAVLVWILVIHFIEGNILNPKIIGTTARIHPAIIIFALLAGEHTYGIIGALLAVPIASIVQTLFLFFKDNRWRPLSELQPATASGQVVDDMGESDTRETQS